MVSESSAPWFEPHGWLSPKIWPGTQPSTVVSAFITHVKMVYALIICAQLFWFKIKSKCLLNI